MTERTGCTLLDVVVVVPGRPGRRWRADVLSGRLAPVVLGGNLDPNYGGDRRLQENIDVPTH